MADCASESTRTTQHDRVSTHRCGPSKLVRARSGCGNSPERQARHQPALGAGWCWASPVSWFRPTVRLRSAQSPRPGDLTWTVNWVSVRSRTARSGEFRWLRASGRVSGPVNHAALDRPHVDPSETAVRDPAREIFSIRKGPLCRDLRDRERSRDERERLCWRRVPPALGPTLDAALRDHEERRPVEGTLPSLRVGDRLSHGVGTAVTEQKVGRASRSAFGWC